MKITKKYVGLIIITLVAIVGGFLFFNHNNNKAISDFANSYKKFDKATSDFSIPVFVANIEENPDLDKFGKIYSQITDSMKNTIPNSERLELSKQAILVNNDLVAYLNNTDNLEEKAGDALIELNTKAAAIKDIELKNKAIEIADLCKKDLDNLNAYKRAIYDKRDITAKLLKNIIDDNGGLDGFINFLSQKDNQAKIQGQNSDLERLMKNFNDLSGSRATAYARFQGLAGIDE